MNHAHRRSPATPPPPHQQGVSRAGLRRRRLHDDKGAASIELVLAAPVLVLLLMLIVQFAVWAHATHIAQAAANEAAQAARLYRASAGDGYAAGTVLLDQSAGTILADPMVTVSRTATTVTVTSLVSPQPSYLACDCRCGSA